MTSTLCPRALVLRTPRWSTKAEVAHEREGVPRMGRRLGHLQTASLQVPMSLPYPRLQGAALRKMRNCKYLRGLYPHFFLSGCSPSPETGHAQVLPERLLPALAPLLPTQQMAGEEGEGRLLP